MGVVRPPAVAGSFYPGARDRLAGEVEQLLSQAAPVELEVEPAALIAPHAGYMYSGPVAAAGYRAIASCSPSRLVLLGPAHFAGFSGVVGPDADAFRTPLGMVAVDAYRPPGTGDNAAAHAREHSLEVQLPFLQTLFSSFTALPLLTGEISAAAVAAVLADAVDRTGGMAVISSDLSHYLDYGAATQRDTVTAASITALEPDRLQPGDACGLLAVQAVLHVARGRGWHCQQLDLRNSGDTAGDRYRVVGYGAFVFGPPARSSDQA